MSRTQRHQKVYKEKSYIKEEDTIHDEDLNEIDPDEESELDPLDPEYGLNTQALYFDDL